jgi:mono/diheme cytochrome c family protein
MNEAEQQKYLEEYHAEKERGVPFFPNILFKDAVVSFVIFLALIALAYFVGAPLEPRADPGDATYLPRPEWYFLWLFQLLKYFPGNLEVIGVIILPTIGIIALILLPFIDRSPHRHISQRPIVAGAAVLAVAAIAFLSIQSVREAPPPTAAEQGDTTANLYAKNCAACHGPSIIVPAGTNLHALIAQGKHADMPSWSADLTTDQIDALAGFIISPGGSQMFTQYCGDCHTTPESIVGDPIKLRDVLDQGPRYPAHVAVNVPQWTTVISPEQRIALLNFLVAPDGQRLFAVNCSGCHGSSVSFTGDATALNDLISKGGQHLEMPAWQTKLTSDQLDLLTSYVLDPVSVPAGKPVFAQYCAVCHGQRVPTAEDYTQARDAIANGGSHKTMPVWGAILTPEQMDALVKYTLDVAKGTPIQVGQSLFARNCVQCHGQFGEGGPNPTRAGDIIAPISTAEFLKTRDDATLRSIIAQGQPNFGMSPFATANGGPLEDEQVDALVTYLRSWAANPPVELPPDVAVARVSLSSSKIYTGLCAQCHGLRGEGGIGPSLRSSDFQTKRTDQDIFDTINKGHSATAMIAWGEILDASQIEQLVGYIRLLGKAELAPTGATRTFTADVKPIFDAKCAECHGSKGGWSQKDYQSVMTTGDHKPTVIAGDFKNSLLMQKILGTQTEGDIMPPFDRLTDAEIQTILDWIASGAKEK